jgi:hypothetical protein
MIFLPTSREDLYNVHMLTMMFDRHSSSETLSEEKSFVNVSSTFSTYTVQITDPSHKDQF